MGFYSYSFSRRSFISAQSSPKSGTRPLLLYSIPSSNILRQRQSIFSPNRNQRTTSVLYQTLILSPKQIPPISIHNRHKISSPFSPSFTCPNPPFGLRTFSAVTSLSLAVPGIQRFVSKKL